MGTEFLTANHEVDNLRAPRLSIPFGILADAGKFIVPKGAVIRAIIHVGESSPYVWTCDTRKVKTRGVSGTMRTPEGREREDGFFGQPIQKVGISFLPQMLFPLILFREIPQIQQFQ